MLLLCIINPIRAVCAARRGEPSAKAKEQGHWMMRTRNECTRADSANFLPPLPTLLSFQLLDNNNNNTKRIKKKNQNQNPIKPYWLPVVCCPVGHE